MAPYPIGRSHTPFDLSPKLASSIDSVAIPESFRSTQQQKRENRTARRVPERQEEHDYQKILLIGEDMVELQANAASIS
jgi:hypothetical protein